MGYDFYLGSHDAILLYTRKVYLLLLLEGAEKDSGNMLAHDSDTRYTRNVIPTLRP